MQERITHNRREETIEAKTRWFHCFLWKKGPNYLLPTPIWSWKSIQKLWSRELLNRLKDVFASFQNHEVRYLIIGGIAAVLYGVPRATFDNEGILGVKYQDKPDINSVTDYMRADDLHPQTLQGDPMAELKTKPTDRSVEDFPNAIPDEKKRQDSFTILELMKRATGSQPKMWGDSIVDFGSDHYKYASGREGDWPLTGFYPRKQNLTLYIMSGFERYDELLAGLGKYKNGKACLYINKLTDIDLHALEQLVKQSVEHMVKANP